MNSILIDIIFVIFLLVMCFYGYVKGFITRIYDVLTTILVLFLSCVLVGPVSNIWQVYQYNESDLIATVVGTAINFVIVFVIVFVVLFVIKKIVGIFVKPLLKGLMKKFKLTTVADHVLGIAISVIEAIIFAYIVLVFVFIPFYAKGATLIEDTVISKHIVNIVPSVTENVIEITNTFQNPGEITTSHQLNSLVELLLVSQDYHILDDGQIQTIIEKNVEEELKKENITLSKEKKEKFQEMLSSAGYNKEDIESLLKNINVSGE